MRWAIIKPLITKPGLGRHKEVGLILVIQRRRPNIALAPEKLTACHSISISFQNKPYVIAGALLISVSKIS
jgi:hypothetical protein